MQLQTVQKAILSSNPHKQNNMSNCRSPFESLILEKKQTTKNDIYEVNNLPFLHLIIPSLQRYN